MQERHITVGQISAVFGVKGWLKVHSYTEPMENILSYTCDQWLLEKNGQQQSVKVDEARRHGNGIIVHIKDIDDRDVARQFCKSQIRIPVSAMPALDEDDFYWHQLQGLNVYQLNDQGMQGDLLGVVDYLLETGANDVLVIKTPGRGEGSRGEGNSGEVLIPYVPEQVVKRVDIERRTLLVDWTPDWDLED